MKEVAAFDQASIVVRQLWRQVRIRHTFLFRLLLCLGWAAQAFAYSTGPDPGLNGVFGASTNCTLCHDNFPLNSGTGGVILSGQPASRSPGQTYALTVTVQPSTQPSSMVYGFQLSAVVDSTNQQAGTLTKVNNAVQIV